jgi:hypothetical protein
LPSRFEQAAVLAVALFGDPDLRRPRQFRLSAIRRHGLKQFTSAGNQASVQSNFLWFASLKNDLKSSLGRRQGKTTGPSSELFGGSLVAR